MWECLVDFATSDGYFQSSDALAFVKRYSRKLGLEPKTVRIKDQKHLWGSCGKDRIVNLNWRLILCRSRSWSTW